MGKGFAQKSHFGSWSIINAQLTLSQNWAVFAEGQVRSQSFFNHHFYYEAKGGVEYKLNKKIKFAIYELGLIEKNGLFGSKFNKEMDFICKNNIKKSLIEIINAFGFSAKDVLQT